MNSTDQARKIYMVLQRQAFADWYSDDGIFGKHITGDEKLTDEQVLESIKKMFNLTDGPEPVKLAKGRITSSTGIFEVTIRLTGLSPIMSYMYYELVVTLSNAPDKVPVGHSSRYSDVELKDLREKGILKIFEN